MEINVVNSAAMCAPTDLSFCDYLRSWLNHQRIKTVS